MLDEDNKRKKEQAKRKESYHKIFAILGFHIGFCIMKIKRLNKVGSNPREILKLHLFRFFQENISRK